MYFSLAHLLHTIFSTCSELQEMNQLRTMFQDKLLSLEQKYIQTRLNSISPHSQGTTMRSSFSERKSPLSSPKNTTHNRPGIPLSAASFNKANPYENKGSDRSVMDGMEDSMRMQQLYERVANTPLRNSTNNSVDLASNDVKPSANKVINNSVNGSFSQMSVPAQSPVNVSANNSVMTSSPLFEETRRLDRQYADAREAIRSLTSRLTRPLPMDSL